MVDDIETALTRIRRNKDSNTQKNVDGKPVFLAPNFPHQLLQRYAVRHYLTPLPRMICSTFFKYSGLYW